MNDQIKNKEGILVRRTLCGLPKRFSYLMACLIGVVCFNVPVTASSARALNMGLNVESLAAAQIVDDVQEQTVHGVANEQTTRGEEDHGYGTRFQR